MKSQIWILNEDNIGTAMLTLSLGFHKVVYGPNWFDGSEAKTLPILCSTTIQSLMTLNNFIELKSWV